MKVFNLIYNSSCSVKLYLFFKDGDKLGLVVCVFFGELCY